MKYKKSILLGIILIVIVSLSFFAFRYFANNRNYVVSVNGEKTSIGEYKLVLSGMKQRLSDLLEQQSGQKITDFNKVLGDKKAIDIAKEQTLESIVNYKIFSQEAKKVGVQLTADEIKQIDSKISQVILQDAKLAEGIKNGEFTANDIKTFNVELSTANKFKEKIYNDIANTIIATEQEITDYYNNNLSQYETVRAKHILISTVDTSNNELPKEQVEAAKKKAEDILAKANAGQDFATLAKQYTEDPGSKDTGGEYTFSRGDMVKEFEDAAFSLKPGQISGLVKTQFGYHIIKLEQKYDKEQTIKIDSVKQKVKNDVEKTKFDNELNKRLEDWKKKSTISRNDKVYNSIM